MKKRRQNSLTKFKNSEVKILEELKKPQFLNYQINQLRGFKGGSFDSLYNFDEHKKVKQHTIKL